MAWHPSSRARSTSQAPSTAPSHAQTKQPSSSRRRLPHLIFSFLYRSTYTILLLFLLALLAITPGDHIYQTITNNRLGNVFVVAGTYLVTAILALFIYASRLYTNRSALAAIPRSYLPISEPEVGKKVRRIIDANARRSALVAWEGKPRDLADEVDASAHQSHEAAERAQLGEKHPIPNRLYRAVSTRRLSMEALPRMDPADPSWGGIAHPGWSSPSHATLPGLHFETVIGELPHLLEARAVSLAPPDPAFAFLGQGEEAGQVPGDPRWVAQLQRRGWEGVREYVGRLQEMGLFIGLEKEAGDEEMDYFLLRYEYARYSVEPLSEGEFEELMAGFSRVLGRLGSSPVIAGKGDLEAPRPGTRQREIGRHSGQRDVSVEGRADTERRVDTKRTTANESKKERTPAIHTRQRARTPSPAPSSSSVVRHSRPTPSPNAVPSPVHIQPAARRDAQSDAVSLASSITSSTGSVVVRRVDDYG